MQAEILPLEPDPGHTGVGKSKMSTRYILCTSIVAIPKVLPKKIKGMELTINHQNRFLDPAPTSLEGLLQQELAGKIQGVAVAINNRVIPKCDWSSTTLKNQDQIILITASQGG